MERRFEALGRTIAVCATSPELLSRLTEVLVDVWVPTERDPDIRYEIGPDPEGFRCVRRQGTRQCEVGAGDARTVLACLGYDLEWWWAGSLPRKVAVHAGAVSWRGLGILLPALSGLGKTTLTRALCAAGADYLTDDHAIIDRSALIHPYPRQLSLTDGGILARKSAESLGLSVAVAPVPTRLVIATSYQPGSAWDLVEMTAGQLAAYVASNVFGLSRRPKLAMAICSRLASRARGFRTPRGNASEAAELILQLAEQVA